MPESFTSTLSPDYATLASATDASVMLKRFRDSLASVRAKKISIESLEIPRVFARPGGEFLIQYQLDLKAHRRDKSDRILYYGYMPGASGARPEYTNINEESVIRLDDIRLLIPIFPFDPSLKYLTQFTQHDYALDYFRKAAESGLPGFSDADDLSWEILSYRLERRCVIKYSFYAGKDGKNQEPLGTVIAKFYRINRLSRVKDIAGSLENQFNDSEIGHLVVPRVLHADREKGLLIFGEAPGNSLHFYIKSNIFETGCAAAGSILRKLHETNIANLSNYNLENELDSLAKAAEITGSIFPDFKKPFKDILGQLGERKAVFSAPDDTVLSHRDFYDKQIIYSGSQTTLLDCDNAAYADPALDFGNFLAHIKLRQLQFPDRADNLNRGAEAFKINYKAIQSDNFRMKVKWWQAATLLRLVSLYSLRPRWHRLSGALISEAGKTFNQ